MDVLRFILALKDPVPTCILPFDEATLKYGVAGLNDILIHTSNNLTFFKHASLCDFLLQRSRAGQYCVDLDQARATVAILSFDNLMNPCKFTFTTFSFFYFRLPSGHMTYYGDFILKHLQSILPRSSPTPALLLKIESVTEHNEGTRIVKFNIREGHWDVIAKLFIIIGTSVNLFVHLLYTSTALTSRKPFRSAHSLEIKLRGIVHAYLSTEMKKYADEPSKYLVALLAVLQQRPWVFAKKSVFQGSAFSYLWSALGINSQAVEIDHNSLNIWDMFSVPEVLGSPRSDAVCSAWDIISSSISLTQSQELCCSTCIKLVKCMIEDPGYSGYVSFVLLRSTN